jgi:hypothetical protein
MRQSRREAFSHCFASVSAGPTWFSPIGIAAANAKVTFFAPFLAKSACATPAQSINS